MASLKDFAAAVLVVTASTSVGLLLSGRQSLADVAMVFLLGIVLVAMRRSFMAAIVAAVLSVLSYDFFFIPPYLSFSVDDGRHVVTFAVMFVIGVLISNLTRRIRDQADAAVASAIERARIAEVADRERLQSSLLSSVSHDLRTPLAVITGSATTLLRESTTLDSASSRDLLAAIRDESARLTRLVSDLLDMTRLAGGALHVHKAWESIEAVVGAATGRAEHPGFPIEVDVPRDLPLAPFDAVLLEQVLLNLLENASKYAPEGSPTEVVVRADAREVAIEVRDRGPGVAEIDRPHVFEKFYRAAGSKAGGGAGLGLAICRGIVEAHGGHIAVTPREGGGSVFRFTIPIEGSPPAVEEDRGTA